MEIEMHMQSDGAYRSADGLVMKRETGLTPNGNDIGNRWVLRGDRGEWIDMSTYRHDLAAAHNLHLIGGE
jgi:hypothetical protein